MGKFVVDEREIFGCALVLLLLLLLLLLKVESFGCSLFTAVVVKGGIFGCASIFIVILILLVFFGFFFFCCRENLWMGLLFFFCSYYMGWGHHIRIFECASVFIVVFVIDIGSGDRSMGSVVDFVAAQACRFLCVCEVCLLTMKIRH